MFLLALARRPEPIILDEPSEGLDPVSIEELLESLHKVRAAGTSIFCLRYTFCFVPQSSW